MCALTLPVSSFFLHNVAHPYVFTNVLGTGLALLLAPVIKYNHAAVRLNHHSLREG